jgi:hypothetical protein
MMMIIFLENCTIIIVIVIIIVIRIVMTVDSLTSGDKLIICGVENATQNIEL